MLYTQAPANFCTFWKCYSTCHLNELLHDYVKKGPRLANNANAAIHARMTYTIYQYSPKTLSEYTFTLRLKVFNNEGPKGHFRPLLESSRL